MTNDCLDQLKRFFPLTNAGSVLRLFTYEIDECEKPNYAVLSLILGIIENTLTSKKTNTTRIHSKTWLQYLSRTKNHAFIKIHRVYSSVCKRGAHCTQLSSPTVIITDNFEFPPIQWCDVEELYVKFEEKIKKGFVEKCSENVSLRQVIKVVSDIIWTTLSKNYYKDQPHLQTLYSYSTGNKLDCFGVAYTVVAGCQILGFDDIRLGLSEDHAWVVFWEDGREENAEVTWHGKGDEHKRGQPIKSSKQWLYLNGNAVICTRKMMISSLIYSINTTIDNKSESEDLAIIQHQLLWLCYDRGHLKMYPMAVACLADLEEICAHPKATRTSLQLFEEAVEIARSKYRNHHVYPYEYLAIYYFRQCLWKQSLQALAESAAVIAQYNCSSDDEEISKYFNEATANFVPHIITELKEKYDQSSLELNGDLNENAQCFASILLYFDGLCKWEEDAPKSVIGELFAKCFTDCVQAFSEQTRRIVCILNESESNQISNNIKNETVSVSLSVNHYNHSSGETKDKISVALRSHKMIAVSQLLFSKKINTSAIKLQLTAQSQIAVTKKRKLDI